MTIKSVLYASLGVAFVAWSAGHEALAHEITGVQSYYACHASQATAFVRSPNPGSGNQDYPLVVLDERGRPTGEHIVVITLQNSSDFDARVTSLGFAWTGESGDFQLVQLGRTYNQLTNSTAGGRRGSAGPADYTVMRSIVSPSPIGDVEFAIRNDVHGVPGFPHTTLDFALVTGQTFSGGKPSDGLANDRLRHEIAFKGVLPKTVAASHIEDLLNDAYVRFRLVGSTGDGSDTGIFKSQLPPISCP